MKKILLLTVFIFTSACADKSEIQTSLEPVFGKIAQENIVTTEFKGISEVILNNPISSIFVSDDGKYIIQGDIINLQKRAKIKPSNKIIKLKKDLLDAISDTDKIIFKAKNEKHIVNVFTDVDCPFCTKLHANMAEMNDLGITIKYLASPLEGLHPTAEARMGKIWCAKDRVRAMDDYKRKRIIPDSPKCDNPVASQLAIAQQLGVNGTPALFLENGENIAGYMPAKALLKRIENSKK